MTCWTRSARTARIAAPPTVYRALDFLREQGLVHRLESLNAFVGCTRPDRTHVSQFLICTGCQAVAELDAPEVGSAVSQSAAKAGFVVDRMTIEMHGLCPACSKGAEARRNAMPDDRHHHSEPEPAPGSLLRLDGIHLARNGRHILDHIHCPSRRGRSSR